MLVHSPPAWIEWLKFAAVLGLGGLLLSLGGWAGRRSARLRNAAAGLGVGAAVAGIAGSFPPFQAAAGPMLAALGGEGVFICLGALLLFGVARPARPRAIRPGVLRIAILVAFFAITTFRYGALAWCYLGDDLRLNYPSPQGVLRQASLATCAPAAGSMLLHRYGIRISEGDLAQMANTNPLLGTFEYSLAHAVQLAARERGLRAHIQRVSYEQASALHRPFVAFVAHPTLGGHALLVLRAHPTALRVADPALGDVGSLPRGDFEAMWDRVIVWIGPAPTG